VEDQRRLARAGDSRDDGDAVVGDVDGDVLQVVLPGSLDPEPHGLGHSSDPPEMESLLDRCRGFNSETLDRRAADAYVCQIVMRTMAPEGAEGAIRARRVRATRPRRRGATGWCGVVFLA